MDYRCFIHASSTEAESCKQVMGVPTVSRVQLAGPSVLPGARTTQARSI